MPPKKQRVPFKRSNTKFASEAAVGTPQVGPTKTPIVQVQAPTIEIVIYDGWTDEQETTLFKAIAIYRWKPAGKSKAPN